MPRPKMDDRAGKGRDHGGRKRDDKRCIGLNGPSKVASAVESMEDRHVDRMSPRNPTGDY